MNTRAFALAALAAANMACQAADAVTPDANRKTETFTGTLSAKGSGVDPVTVAGNGNMDVTLVSLTPDTTITLGLGIGQPTAQGCSLLTSNESSRVGTILSGSVTPGAFCVAVYDIGNVTTALNYTLTVAHP
jgi:hypothetical protein